MLPFLLICADPAARGVDRYTRLPGERAHSADKSAYEDQGDKNKNQRYNADYKTCNSHTLALEGAGSTLLNTDCTEDDTCKSNYAVKINEEGY